MKHNHQKRRESILQCFPFQSLTTYFKGRGKPSWSEKQQHYPQGVLYKAGNFYQFFCF